MDRLIPTINKLQDVLNIVGENSEIQLPQIVVVGAQASSPADHPALRMSHEQSSGKSSILENVVGKDFLPRGTGIVTRVPLVLQLVQTADDEWATFQHAGGKVFRDFEQVRQEIVDQTERITGPGKAVSNEPIHLRVHSPNVVNLTLVDLPGLTKVAVADQPQDIGPQIRRLVRHYIDNPNSLILAVSPANADIANSDSLQIAKEVDPQGDRTLAIVTKLDLMDRGTDAKALLSGEVLPVKLGIIGIVNRSQNDINCKTSIQDSLDNEKRFFRTHYPEMADRCGCAFLADTLHHLLLQHIRACLPDLKQRIKSLQIQTHKRVQELGEPLKDDATRGATLLTNIMRYAEAVKASISGSGAMMRASDEQLPLSTGARIYHIFHYTFGGALNKMDAMEGLDSQKILAEIRNAAGPRPSLFIPEAAFEALIKKQIQRLESPSVQCAELIHEELLAVLRQCLKLRELARFEALRERLLDCARKFLERCLPRTLDMIRNLIHVEMSYINTKHPDFENPQSLFATPRAPVAEPVAMLPEDLSPGTERLEDYGPNAKPARKEAKGGNPGFFNMLLNSMKRQPEEPVLNSPSVEEISQALQDDSSPDASQETQIVTQLVTSYFTIVRKTITDMVPKTIMAFMVSQLQEELHHQLVQELYGAGADLSLLDEDPRLVKERTAAKEKLRVLDECNTIVSQKYRFNSSTLWHGYGAVLLTELIHLMRNRRSKIDLSGAKH
ncbi:uncharacterized protein MONBRDRAFT_34545 [Monosiga brevicollis MX1]|uniref:Dynamin GTPase n=1 Tax=Monosiga brevicollis TaxID=81824 RepID=A9VCG6_MONBE|nr:uncharacterized protein MONBRDRAFT_34545 [Monosiga brevicollis MX1]EDQ84781.1 predicted protein [Monosiga brevicollis MX1]|eukprot:XP_001750431.1 hypothetical protein [Monosiga brevicollis MX1]